ncbi:MAG: sugar phosphate isomerase/epimerase family protein [Candidatus Zipacnadales bacterium]
MRLGCCAYSYRDLLKDGRWTLEDFIRTCCELGLDGVELTSYYFPTTERAYLNTIKRCCASYGLHISGGAVGSNFCKADPGERRAQVEMTKEWIDHCVVLGAPCIRVFAGPVPEGHTEEEAVDWAVAALRECAAYGKERGVVVALENHGGITASAQQVDRLVREVNNDWFGVNLDFGNYRNPATEFALTAPHAVTTHAKVTYRDTEGNRQKVDYALVRQVMEGVGYRGYISIEYEEPEDAVEGVARFVEELKTVFR